MSSIPSLDTLDVRGKRVLLRVDINSPIERTTGRIADDTRIERSLPTIVRLVEEGARLTIIAHQGDSLDYHNLVSLEPHAALLAEKLGRPVAFIDDVAGPAARERVSALEDGEILLLDNVRFHGEELSTFERDVSLTPQEMADTYVVRNLAPLFDCYVNDAFAAAHRNAPSMVAFQRLMPSAAGLLLEAELEGLGRVVDDPDRPSVFLLGGLKVSDGFSIMDRVLDDGLADRVLTTGVLGEIFLAASGVELGAATEDFIAERDLDRFKEVAARVLESHRERVLLPLDLAIAPGGDRREVSIDELPVDDLLLDIGEETISMGEREIARAGTVFVNGPPGAYEIPGADVGTRRLWQAVASTPGRSVIGGGDTIASAGRFVDLESIDFVSTGGGAMIRFVGGQALPLLEAFGRAGRRT